MRKFKIIFVALCLAALAVALSCRVGKAFDAQIAQSGRAKVEEVLHAQINRTCLAVIENTDASYVAETPLSAESTQVKVNALAVNKLANQCNVQCALDLRQYERLPVSFPKGALFGGSYWADKGRSEIYTLHVSYDVATQYTAFCQSVGINQIRYAVYLVVEATAHVTVPAAIEDLRYTYYVPICEKMYAATVPNVYVAGENGTNFLDLIP